MISKYRFIKNFFVFLVGLFLSTSLVFSYGDKRFVTEPVIPKSCSVLKSNDASDSTSLIQSEINRCSKLKQVVTLQATDKHFHFYSGPFNIPSNGGLYLDKGVVLVASSDPALYDNGNHTCGTLDDLGRGCKPFIVVDNTVNSGIYGTGIIDGQGNAKIKNTNITWWNLASEAQKKNKQQNVPRLIEIRNSKNFTLYNVSLKNSPNFHVITNKVDGFTSWGVKINTPSDARNTDGIDPASATNVTITHTNISTGDDNVAIKAGGGGSTNHVTISNNNFGKGHGMSIGSETYSGVSDILVSNLTMEGTTNGLRIKSSRLNGGLVNQVTYKNICIKDVQFPVYLDMFYNKNSDGNKIPQFKNIRFIDVKVLTPGQFVMTGIKGNNIQVSFENFSTKKGSTWKVDNVSKSGTVLENATGSSCPVYYNRYF